MIKETNEEANLPLELAEKIQPAGCVRYYKYLVLILYWNFDFKKFAFFG